MQNDQCKMEEFRRNGLKWVAKGDTFILHFALLASPTARQTKK